VGPHGNAERVSARSSMDWAGDSVCATAGDCLDDHLLGGDREKDGQGVLMGKFLRLGWPFIFELLTMFRFSVQLQIGPFFAPEGR